MKAIGHRNLQPVDSTLFYISDQPAFCGFGFLRRKEAVELLRIKLVVVLAVICEKFQPVSVDGINC